MSSFRDQLTPAYARPKEPGPGQDSKDCMIDMLTEQLANALRVNKKLSSKVIDLEVELSQLQKGHT